MADDEDARFMNIALAEARKAAQKAEVPVGAVLVAEDGTILSVAHNQTITLGEPTAHAEIMALRQGAKIIRNYRLLNTTLYVTVEPCIMCMGAVVHARLAKLVYGVKDPKWGAAGSLYDFSTDRRLNHTVEIIAGVCEKECRSLIQGFFHTKR